MQIAEAFNHLQKVRVMDVILRCTGVLVYNIFIVCDMEVSIHG